MRKVLTDNKTNLLNASVRIVHQEENFLTYSPEPAFSLVLYINQTTDDEGNRRMKKATEELIDLTIAHKGRFFLPYQLYYSTRSVAAVLSADQRLLRGEAEVRSGGAVHQHVLSEVRVVGTSSSPSCERSGDPASCSVRAGCSSQRRMTR